MFKVLKPLVVINLALGQDMILCSKVSGSLRLRQICWKDGFWSGVWKAAVKNFHVHAIHFIGAIGQDVISQHFAELKRLLVRLSLTKI